MVFLTIRFGSFVAFEFDYDNSQYSMYGNFYFFDSRHRTNDSRMAIALTIDTLFPLPATIHKCLEGGIGSYVSIVESLHRTRWKHEVA